MNNFNHTALDMGAGERSARDSRLVDVLVIIIVAIAVREMLQGETLKEIHCRGS